MNSGDVPGRFGEYGGRYAPEVLTAALEELDAAIQRIVPSAGFQAELQDLLANYAGRPTPLYHARRMSEDLGGASLFSRYADPRLCLFEA